MERVENIVGKGENAGFSKAFFLWVVKSRIVWKRVNTLPNSKIMGLSKLKAFADGKINVTQKLKFALGRVENIVGKGENAAYPRVFQRVFF